MKDFIKRQLSGSEVEKSSRPTQSKVTYASAVNVESSETRTKVPQDKNIVQAEKFILSTMLHKKPYAFFKKDISEYFTDGREEFYKVIVELSDIANEKELPKMFFERFAGEQVNAEGSEEIVKNERSEKAIEIINYSLKNIGDENDLNYFKDCVYLIYKGYAERKIESLTKMLEVEIEKEKRAQILNELKELMSNIKNKKVDL